MQKTDDSQIIANGLKQLHSRAITAISQNNYDDAIACYNQILTFEQNLKWHRQQAETLVNLANLFIIKNDFTGAESSLEQAIKLMRTYGTAADIANINLIQAHIAESKGNHRQSQTILENCIRANIPISIKGRALMQLAAFFLESNELAKAQDLYGKAIDAFESCKETTFLIQCLHKRAELFQLSGQVQWRNRDLARIEQLISSNNQKL